MMRHKYKLIIWLLVVIAVSWTTAFMVSFYKPVPLEPAFDTVLSSGQQNISQYDETAIEEPVEAEFLPEGFTQPPSW